MRVLTIIDSLIVGGAEQSLSTLAPHLVARGVDMHVAYLFERPGVGPQLEAAGAQLHSLTGRGGRLGALVRTMRAIRRIEPDLVHTTLFEADIIGRTAAKLNGIPSVSSFVTESYGPEHVNNPEYKPWKVRAAHLTDAVTARFVTRFHAVSATSATLMSRRLKVRPDKVDVVPRGRDVTVLGQPSVERRRTTRHALGLGEETPLVVAAGRHHNFKGLDILVRSMPAVVDAIPQAQLLIAGRSGPATAELERLASTGGVEDSVTLAGYRTDVPDLMCAADVFVLPSRAEGLPGVLIESMAMGTPTVASDIPSVREVAGTGPATMELVPLDAPAAMADAIVGLLEDPDNAATMAAAARERFLSTYTVDNVADATVDFYRKCLNGSPASAPFG